LIFKKGNCNAILCDYCESWYHLKCAGLNKKTFNDLVQSDDNWFCNKCKNIIFPFNSIDSKTLETLSFNSININKHENKLCTINLTSRRKKTNSCCDSEDSEYSTNCSICSNNIKKPKSSIPCPNCKHLVHKKCSNLNPNQLYVLKKNPNIWECPKCTRDKFPFTEIEDDEILLTSFNSNWSCNCPNHKPTLPNKSLSDFKLTISQINDSDTNTDTDNSEFDDQFHTYHSLKPDFSYYLTHEFHELKDKVKNPFSILHTNISSLQHNGDNLKLLLNNLEFKFDVIALSETWNPESKSHTFQPPILEGYNNYNGNTGSSLKGGCGFYISKDLKPLPRKDLNIKLKEGVTELETCWYEIILDKQPNRLIGVVYRHPAKNDLKAIEILSTSLETIKK